MFWDFVKIIAYLCVCVFVIWLSYKVSKGLAGYSGKLGMTKYMKPIDRMALGKDSALNIVQVGNKYMLIGISGGKIDMLCELSEEDLVELSAGGAETDIYLAVKDNISPAVSWVSDFAKNVGDKVRKNKKKSRKGNFSDMLNDNIENGEAYDENSVVDELLKNSEMRMNNFKNKLSDKRGDGQE